MDARTSTFGEAVRAAMVEILLDLEIPDPEVIQVAPGELTDRFLDRDAGTRFRVWIAVRDQGATFQVVALARPVEGDPGRLVKADITRENLEVQVIRLVRQLLSEASAARSLPKPRPCRPCRTEVPIRSEGRAALALNAALIGAYAGYSIQRAGGSEDARLTYPLVALGTGVGLGAGMVVADEWDITIGRAWFLSAAAFWPTLATRQLAAHYELEPASSRPAFGLAGTAAGLSLATVAVSLGEIDAGSATLAHSGGFFGMMLGGWIEMLGRGATKPTPHLGMGYGSAAGVLLAGAAGAFWVKPTSSQVLLADLGAGLGALTAAAIASPLALGDASRSDTRWLLGSIGLGAAAGAVIGYALSDSSDRDAANSPRPARHVAQMTRFVPHLALAPRVDRSTRTIPVFGLSGQW